MSYEKITTKEIALKQIESLRREYLNCNIFSVYDYNCLSMQELLCTFFEKINQCVDATNKTVVLVEWLVGQGLKAEVAEQLNQWFVDGTLKTVINEVIFNELNTKVDTLRENFETNKIHVNNRFDTVEQKISDNKKLLQDYYNVVELGADPTGAVDCTNVLDANKDKKLYFPSGIYKHSGIFIVNNVIGDNANLHYVGTEIGVRFDSNGIVVKGIKFTSSKTDKSLGICDNHNTIEFINCEFEGGNKTGMILQNCEQICFNGCNGFKGNGSHGLLIKNSRLISMNGLAVFQNSDFGVYVEGNSTGTVLLNSMICYNKKGGVYVDGSADCRRFILSNNQILFNKDESGVGLSHAVFLSSLQNGIVSGNTIVGSKTIGIGMTSCHNMNIMSNQLEGIESGKAISLSSGSSACNIIGNSHPSLTLDIVEPTQHTVIDYTGQNFIKGGISVENIVRFGHGNIQNYANGNMDIICDKPGGTSTLLIGNGDGSQPDNTNVDLKLQGRNFHMLNSTGQYTDIQVNGLNNLVVGGKDMVNLVDVPAHHTTPGNYGSFAVSDTDLFVRTKSGKWKYVSLRDYQVLQTLEER